MTRKTIADLAVHTFIAWVWFTVTAMFVSGTLSVWYGTGLLLGTAAGCVAALAVLALMGAVAFRLARAGTECAR